MAEHLHLQLLGGLRISQNGAPLTGFVSSKAQALLCYLALSGRPQFRSTLAALFWGELPESGARMNLRHVLANLHRIVGQHLLITRDSVAFERAGAELDVERFEAALRGAAPGELGRLREAVGWYGGDLLHGFFVRDAPEWDEWMIGQRERLRGLALNALHTLATYHHERVETVYALEYATRLLQLDPWREEAHRQVMLLLAESGQTSTALDQYRACCAILQAELGADPDPETTALYERIKAGAVVPRLPPKPSHNLPVPPTTLLGRAAELDTIERLLAQPATRLLTLAGPGGVGKTHLALEIGARHAARFADGVFLVDLAPVRQAGLLVTAIAQTLGVRETGQRSLLDGIVAHLRDKHMLLLLDNFEHLLPAAPVVSELLARCRRLQIVVTSRAPLRIRGEQECDLAPLAVPDLASPAAKTLTPGTVTHFAAVELFVRHARSVWPGFTLTDHNAVVVAEICCRLDGLPLALELAAARIKLLSPDGIKARLGNRLALLTGGASDLPARQQTLRGAIEWSYDLLEAAEQQLFRRLAVFVGSYRLDDVQAVCGLEPGNSAAVMDAFNVLLDRSLVRMVGSRLGEQRFDMLGTINEYAAEQLDASGDGDTMRRRHAAHFLVLAELAEPHLQGAEQRLWLDRLELEHDNLRAALQWALSSGDAETAQRLAAALGEFWWPRGYLSEGRRWLESAVALGETSPTMQAKALYRAGELAFGYGDYAPSLRFLNQSLVLYRELDDPGGTGRVLRGLSNTVFMQGDEAHAKQLRLEALHLFQQIDDRWGVAWMLYHLALLEHDRERKFELFEQSLAISRAGGFKRTTFAATNDMAQVALAERDYVRAEQLYSECLELCQELGDRWLRAWPLGGLGVIAADAGDYRRATAMLEASLQARRQAQNDDGMARLLSQLGDVARWQLDLQQAAEHYRQSLGLFQAMSYPRGVARCRLVQGLLAIAEADHDTAASLFRAALELLPGLRPAVAADDYLVALAGLSLALHGGNHNETVACLCATLERHGMDREPLAALVAAPDCAVLHHAWRSVCAALRPEHPDAWARGRSMNLADAMQYALAVAEIPSGAHESSSAR